MPCKCIHQSVQLSPQVSHRLCNPGSTHHLHPNNYMIPDYLGARCAPIPSLTPNPSIHSATPPNFPPYFLFPPFSDLLLIRALSNTHALLPSISHSDFPSSHLLLLQFLLPLLSPDLPLLLLSSLPCGLSLPLLSHKLQSFKISSRFVRLAL